MPSLQDEMKRKLRQKLLQRMGNMVDNIDPELIPQANEMLEIAEKQLGIENGDNNSEGEIAHLGGEDIMTEMNEEQRHTAKQIEQLAHKANLKVELLNDRASSQKEVMAKINELAKGSGLEVRVATEKLADNQGFVAGFFGTRTKAKQIAGDLFKNAGLAVIYVTAFAGGVWLIFRVVKSQMPALPSTSEMVS